MGTRTTGLAGLVAGAILGWLVHLLAYGECFESPNGPDTSFGCRLEEVNGAAVLVGVAVACGLMAVGLRRVTEQRR